MMATTHAFVGLAIASGVAIVVPGYATAAAVGAVIGGILPDVDVLATHRKTLHFPAYYGVLSLPAIVLALIVPSAASVGIALCLVAAAIHSWSDAIGSGPAPRPWATPSSRAVYLHPADRWVRPRRWIRYDGAPEDFLLGLVMTAPALVVYHGSSVVWLLVGAGLAISLLYTLFRKPIGRRIERSVDH